MCSSGEPMPPEYHKHNEIYAALFRSWTEWSRRQFSSNQCLHMVYSGADSAIASGAATVRACDEAALQSATDLGFEIAYTVCTNDVTHFIASEELGFHRRLQWPGAPTKHSIGHIKQNIETIEATLPADHRIVLYDKLLQQPAALQELITTSYTALQLQKPANAERYAQLQLCMEEAFHDVAHITLSREMRHLRNADNEAIMLHAYNGPSVVGGATLKTQVRERNSEEGDENGHHEARKTESEEVAQPTDSAIAFVCRLMRSLEGTEKHSFLLALVQVLYDASYELPSVQTLSRRGSGSTERRSSVSVSKKDPQRETLAANKNVFAESVMNHLPLRSRR